MRFEGLPSLGACRPDQRDREEPENYMTTNDYTAERKAVIALLIRGEITLAEAAELAGVSRQLARYWAKQIRIDWKQVRTKRITKAFQKHMSRIQGDPVDEDEDL